MKPSPQLKGFIFGVISSCVALVLAMAVWKIFQPGPAAPAAPAVSGAELVVPPNGTLAHEGYLLFMQNCAHCHGRDAHGDEGPDLHGVTKSDARIAAMIQNGVKGKMPRFGAKLTSSDVQALIAFVRSLKVATRPDRRSHAPEPRMEIR